ncbi:hypothetical protein NDU88_002309 [Pleurodeles waltl]|uniref:Uncharacterized protein n=1 Tax=Pleurodeles waltl TaxID=8319 RepID=A0AAV7WPL3_PLEWA|nr:hypothetical protein NDU88_002309 [Pleurodeles waltl]
MGCVRRWRVSHQKVKWTHLWSVQCIAEEWLKDMWLLAEKMVSSVCPAMWVEVEVTEKDVVRRGKGVRVDEVSDGVAEEGTWSRGSVDESSSECGPGVGVDLEVQVFGGEGGVFGGDGDVDGVLEDDGYSSTYLVGAVSP